MSHARHADSGFHSRAQIGNPSVLCLLCSYVSWSFDDPGTIFCQSSIRTPVQNSSQDPLSCFDVLDDDGSPARQSSVCDEELVLVNPTTSSITSEDPVVESFDGKEGTGLSCLIRSREEQRQNCGQCVHVTSSWRRPYHTAARQEKVFWCPILLCLFVSPYCDSVRPP